MSILRAMECFRRGQFAETEVHCLALLGAARDTVPATRLLAQVYSATGRSAQAIVCLQTLLPLAPNDAGLRRLLGTQQLAVGDVVEAAETLAAALRLEPLNERAHNNLGQALVRLGRLEEAQACFEAALALNPEHASAHNNLGTLLEQAHRYEEALACYCKALACDPQLAEAHCNSGRISLALNRPADALASANRALQLRAQLSEARLLRAHSQRGLGHLQEALQDFEMVLETAPQRADVLVNAASVLLALGRAAEALEYCDRALRRSPDLPEAHLNRAGALRDCGRREEALESCRRALALRPDFSETLSNQGKLLRELGDREGALESFRRALAIEPQLGEARVGLLAAQLPAVPADAAELEVANAGFEAELERLLSWLDSEPHSDAPTLLGGSELFFLAYQEADHLSLLRRFGTACAALMGRWQLSAGMPRPQGAGPYPRRPRVGIVSAFIREHSVYRALIDGWLQGFSAERIEWCIYHLDNARDTCTAAAQARADRYVSGPRALSDWVQTITHDAPDVLIYPEIGMHPMSLRLASLRLAHCQAAAWGHPLSSGLPTIDYFLSGADFEPPGAQVFYSESLLPLANLGSRYEPLALEPVTLQLERLGIDPARPKLICPGTPFKYAPQHDRVLVEIARRIPSAQLVLFAPPASQLHQRLRARLERAFGLGGLTSERQLVFAPWLTPAQFHTLLRQADVLLDTIGFSGFNTVLQAVECALPFVSVEGRFMRGRFGSAALRRLGLTDLVAVDPDAYIEGAVRLAEDPSHREGMRARLRQLGPSLFRDSAPIASLDRFLSSAVRA
jgi:predicted O-linked N-acetylglucosamine transferase (SPINDLY family)